MVAKIADFGLSAMVKTSTYEHMASIGCSTRSSSSIQFRHSMSLPPSPMRERISAEEANEMFSENPGNQNRGLYFSNGEAEAGYKALEQVRMMTCSLLLGGLA